MVKTVKFKDPTYLGDPINVVKIFNDKEVDELIFLDITATVENNPPPFDFIANITSECFMPLAYGGGVRSLADIKKILYLGVEKVAINSYAVENPSFIKSAADMFGRSTIIVSIDVKKNFFGKYRVTTHSGAKVTKLDPVEFAIEMERMGAGELLINSVDRDGAMEGYDIGLVKSITGAVTVPVIACGGAGKLEDLAEVVKKGGANAAGAGSIFVFYGRHRAVLINYPTQQELRQIFS